MTSASTAPTAPIVELIGLSKRFGGVQAVRELDLRIMPGTVHAIVGENGAGKSTAGKMIGGVLRPSAGTIRIDGHAASLHSPREALTAGIAMIDQELALVPARSVIDNIFLARESARLGVLASGDLRARFDVLNERTGFALPGDAIVGRLPIAEQQKVEIMRALARDARLIVMDEPTARLTRHESEQLYAIVNQLRAGGTTIVFVSHFLREVLLLSDTVTVMRDGRLVHTRPAAEETEHSLITAMLGREQQSQYPELAPVAPDAPVRLDVRGLCGGMFDGVDLHVRAGEVVAIGGLIGSGRSEFARAVVGVDPFTAGEVRIDGELQRIRTPADGMRAGLTMLPESRKDQGLVMMRSIAENVTLPHLGDVSALGVVRRGEERSRVRTMMERLGVKAAGPDAPVQSLSGGNQQKVLFAKALTRTPKVLIVDEPTRGVDVGAKRAIYELIAQLAAEGMAVVMISSELEEALGLSHRVVVMRLGRVTADIPRAEATESALLAAAFGTSAATTTA